ATAMDDAGKLAARRAIRALETRGMTNLSSGWLTGAERVAEEMERRPGQSILNRVVVLSDGQANEGIRDERELRAHADRLRMLGIATSTVGIGDDYVSTLMELLAEHGGGRMHDAEHAAEIGEVVAAELRDMRQAVLDNVTLSISVPARALVEPYGGFPV